MVIEQLFGARKYTDSEQQIIRFIERNPRIVVNLSLDELSEQCYVSQASIIRLCKKLGTKGYSDFKIRLASGLNSILPSSQEIHVDIPIHKDSSSKEIADTLLSLNSQALQNAYNNLDYNALRRAAILLSKSDFIHVYGRGESLILAEDFHYKLTRIGKHSSLESLNGFQEAKCLLHSSRLQQAAIVVSHYCNSRQVHYIVDELMNSKIPFVLVTGVDDARPYENMAVATLHVPSAESRYKMGSFASRTGMMYLLDCLYCLIFSMDYETNKNNLTRFSKRKIERSYFYNSSDDTSGNN